MRALIPLIFSERPQQPHTPIHLTTTILSQTPSPPTPRVIYIGQLTYQLAHVWNVGRNWSMDRKDMERYWPRAGR